MGQRETGDQVLCWVCDYGLMILAVAIVIIVMLLRLHQVMLSTGPYSENPLPTLARTGTVEEYSTPIDQRQATFTPTALASATPTPLMITALPSVTPTPSQPEFIIVVMPLNWQANWLEFASAAQSQVDIFVSESRIEQYFRVRVKLLPEGLENTSLGSDNLVYDVITYGLSQLPGDRYVGLTDGDLNPGGESDVVGWTMGVDSLGLVAEASDPFTIAHELGHTFGLCDEYSYSEWLNQDSSYPNGCPNPYPANCPLIENDQVTCDGSPTTDGRYSLMGPAGLSGPYGFNEPCLEHLMNTFEQYLAQAQQ